MEIYNTPRRIVIVIVVIDVVAIRFIAVEEKFIWIFFTTIISNECAIYFVMPVNKIIC